MKTPTTLVEVEQRGMRLLLERTTPGGSGPATGSADRVAGKEPGEGPECREGGTTDRNRDSRAVPPGEAKAAEHLEDFLQALMLLVWTAQEITEFPGCPNRHLASAIWAAADVIDVLRESMEPPEPDSDAPEANRPRT